VEKCRTLLVQIEEQNGSKNTKWHTNLKLNS